MAASNSASSPKPHTSAAMDLGRVAHAVNWRLLIERLNLSPNPGNDAFGIARCMRDQRHASVVVLPERQEEVIGRRLAQREVFAVPRHAGDFQPRIPLAV